MLSADPSTIVLNTTVAPIELHYLPKSDIQAGRPSVALCGAPGTPTTATSSQNSQAVTSYTCPDCMLRYSLLSGGMTNA